MITLISTPGYPDPGLAADSCRWLATESPNNFRLLRRDWIVSGETHPAGFLVVTVTTPYTGSAPNAIAIYDETTDQMYIGKVTNVAGFNITTDIPWVAGMDIGYLQDNSLHAGYYFEGQLTVNSIVQNGIITAIGMVYPLAIVASPDSFGYADLDVSGILRILTSLGKAGTYVDRLVKESNKSGNFIFEFRECWYASLTTSPPEYEWEGNIWYYGECVRSEEQGSNLHEYVPDATKDAPFLNSFDQPVYFIGLPFDISFILPETTLVSPISDIHVQIVTYNSSNIPIDTIDEDVPADALEGFINSILISPATIVSGAIYFTVEITTP